LGTYNYLDKYVLPCEGLPLKPPKKMLGKRRRRRNNGGHPYKLLHGFVGLAYQGKDIVFRLIIEYSSLRDFHPQVIIGLFLYEDFQKMIFWLVLKFEISYRVMIS